MNDSKASSTALSEGDTARLEGLSRPSEGVAAPAAPVPARWEASARTSEWTGARIAALVAGGLLVLVALALLAGGGTALWYDRTQRDAGYVTTGAHQFSTSGSALVTEPTDLGSAGVGWLYSPGLLNKIRIRVTPGSSDSTLFVGIGRAADVDHYLAGVNHTVITDFWSDKVQNVGGGSPGSAPAMKDFWVASATGSGAQTLEWEPAGGSWSAVVMNADGRSGLDVGADLGARAPALPWIAVGLLAAGVVFAVGGALLVGGRRVTRFVFARRSPKQA